MRVRGRSPSALSVRRDTLLLRVLPRLAILVLQAVMQRVLGLPHVPTAQSASIAPEVVLLVRHAPVVTMLLVLPRPNALAVLLVSTRPQPLQQNVQVAPQGLSQRPPKQHNAHRVPRTSTRTVTHRQLVSVAPAATIRTLQQALSLVRKDLD